MIPILFDASATAFTSNGIGRLSDASMCEVTEERNGVYTLEMEYPVGGAHYSDLKHSNIILAKPSQGGSVQPFRIYSVSRPIGGMVTVSAEHISYQLSHVPVMPFSAQGIDKALQGFKTYAGEANPFTFTTDITSTSSFAVPVPSSVRSYLGGRRGSILDVYGGGEYEWDGYNVILHRERGADHGVTLRYGKDITDLTQEESIANTYTGICPYWFSTEGQLVTLPEKVIHSSNASNFPYQRTIPYDFTDVFETAPTVAQLREYTERFIVKNKIGVPSVSLEVSFISLADTMEYKDLVALESVNLCDTITVSFPRLGVDTKAKVVETVWDVLRDRYVSITIGEKRTSLATTIEDQMERVDQVPTAERVLTDIDRATGVLRGGIQGHVVINRNQQGFANEILFLDSENIYQARNVIRINNAGIGFSTTGYQGQYANAWTIDGVLNADFIRTGDLTIGGTARNVDGKIIIFDKDGKVLMQMSKNGITLNSGTLNAPVIKGGQITIGNNFSVNSDGVMKATSATFTGDIKGGTIKIGSRFSVDANGYLKTTDGEFTGAIKGGTINIGSGFAVDKTGKMTAKGADIGNGKISGGSITIGKNFSVNSSGKLVAKGGDFSGGAISGGSITGTKITVGSDFSVSSSGKLKARGVEITDGSISIGDAFEVDDDGNLTATSAEITGGTIEIGSNFSVDSDGNLTAKGNASFTGNITGATIRGSDISIKNGEFAANEDEVAIGGFVTYSTSGSNHYLGSENGEMGIGTNRDYHWWTGWDGNNPNISNPQDILAHYGTAISEDNMYAQEIYLSDSIFQGSSKWWGVGETIADIYDRIEALESAVGNS